MMNNTELLNIYLGIGLLIGIIGVLIFIERESRDRSNESPGYIYRQGIMQFYYVLIVGSLILFFLLVLFYPLLIIAVFAVWRMKIEDRKRSKREWKALEEYRALPDDQKPYKDIPLKVSIDSNKDDS